MPTANRLSSDQTITREGSGIAAVLATRKPKLGLCSVEAPSVRSNAVRSLEKLKLSQLPPRRPRRGEGGLFTKSESVSSHSQTFPPCPAVPLAANGTLEQHAGWGVAETVSGEALVLNLGGAVAVGGMLSYQELR